MSIRSEDYSQAPPSSVIQDLLARIAELEAENQLLQHQVMTDDLTGLYNRRGFKICLSQEWRRCTRREEPVSLILIDIDQFKGYNDHRGRAGGDMLLRHLAQSFISISKRAGDIVSRYSGDEFAAILPDTDIGGAMGLASTMRVRSNHAGVSLSVGVASLVPRQGQSSDVLLEAADAALHAAKRQGGNRVITAALESVQSVHHGETQGEDAIGTV